MYFDDKEDKNVDISDYKENLQAIVEKNEKG